MKAFVIKNKEGKYYCGFDYFAGINIFSERIIDGLNTQTPTLKHCREEIKDFNLKDCKPVKITIAEGDFDTYIDKLQDERDFERRDKTYIVKQLNDPNDYVIREDYIKLEQENKRLKEQLAIREKALELACDYVRDEWERTGLEDKARKVGGFENYFVEQAKENLK